MSELIKTLLAQDCAAYSEVFLIQQFRSLHAKMHTQSWSALHTDSRQT